MSRQLKFRVWSDYHNKFVIEGGEFGLSRLFESFSVCLDKGFSRDSDRKAPSEIEHYIIQQFTGKTDEQNVDIYEGDIVYLNHYNVPDVDKRCLFEIIFEDGAFQLKPIKLGQAPNGEVSGFFWMRYIEGLDADGYEKYRYELPPPQPICGFNRMVVVGNIFESRELLK